MTLRKGMTTFLRSDLIGFYEWPVDGELNNRLSGEPDDSEFNRNNGYEVLYMIRHLMSAQNTLSTEAGHELEMMIKVAPTGLKTQRQMKDWVISN